MAAVPIAPPSPHRVLATTVKVRSRVSHIAGRVIGWPVPASSITAALSPPNPQGVIEPTKAELAAIEHRMTGCLPLASGVPKTSGRHCVGP